jgi:hypothetical protein
MFSIYVLFHNNNKKLENYLYSPEKQNSFNSVSLPATLEMEFSLCVS